MRYVERTCKGKVVRLVDYSNRVKLVKDIEEIKCTCGSNIIENIEIVDKKVINRGHGIRIWYVVKCRACGEIWNIWENYIYSQVVSYDIWKDNIQYRVLKSNSAVFDKIYRILNRKECSFEHYSGYYTKDLSYEDITKLWNDIYERIKSIDYNDTFGKKLLKYLYVNIKAIKSILAEKLVIREFVDDLKSKGYKIKDVIFGDGKIWDAIIIAEVNGKEKMILVEVLNKNRAGLSEVINNKIERFETTKYLCVTTEDGKKKRYDLEALRTLDKVEYYILIADVDNFRVEETVKVN